MSALNSLLIGYPQSQGTSMSGGRFLLFLQTFRPIQIIKKGQLDPSAASQLLSDPRHCARSISRTRLGP